MGNQLYYKSCITSHAPISFLPLYLSAAASVFFEKELETQVVMEGKSVVLSCEVSSANVPVTWKKDNVVLEEGGRYTLIKRGPTHSLEIKKLNLEDAGEYSCVTRGKKTTAKLVVRGRCILLQHFIPYLGI